MSATESTSAHRTPLYACHVALGARMVDFAGFDMPVRYTSDKAEHMVVRTGCGLFDVSHMGEVFLRGPGALDAADRLFSNDIRRIAIGQAMYTGLLNPNGGFVDDCIVYRFPDDSAGQVLLVCVNASNRHKDFEHMRAVCEAEFSSRVVATDDSDAWAQIAVQGPTAIDVVAALCGENVRSIEMFHFAEMTFNVGATSVDNAIIARTGYTGEDGFELYVPAATGAAVLDALVAASTAERPVVPCGLGARDTLRLEAGLSLYGNDIDDTISPLEAGLNFIVKLNDATGAPRNFIGADALRAQKAAGIPRKLCGLVMLERGIPRGGYTVRTPEGVEVGVVKSGTQAPYLDKAIAIALVEASAAAAGGELCVVVREKPLRAAVQKLPFYRRGASPA